MENYWIFIASTLTVLSGLSYFGMKSYIGEKLKNIATHEDIGKITNEVESVKQVFTYQTEKLKQELSVLTNKSHVLFTEEKEALLAYLSAWNIWYSHLGKMINSFTNKEFEEIDEFLDEIDRVKEENNKADDRIQICVSKLELFMTDVSIITTVHNLNAETYRLQILNEKYMETHMDYTTDLNFYMGKYNIANEEGNEYAKKELMDDFLKLTDEKKDEHNLYNIQLLELDEKIFFLKKEFITLSKEYIRRGI